MIRVTCFGSVRANRSEPVTASTSRGATILFSVVLLTTPLVIVSEAHIWPGHLSLTECVLFGITMVWVFVTALLSRFNIPYNVK